MYSWGFCFLQNSLFKFKFLLQLRKSHPQNSASHLLGLQGPQHTPAKFIGDPYVIDVGWNKGHVRPLTSGEWHPQIIFCFWKFVKCLEHSITCSSFTIFYISYFISRWPLCYWCWTKQRSRWAFNFRYMASQNKRRISNRINRQQFAHMVGRGKRSKIKGLYQDQIEKKWP